MFTHYKEGGHETIVILACGPSISDVDFSLLENFVTIGLNLILESFDPTYHMWADSWVPRDHPELLAKSKAKKICHARAYRGGWCQTFETYNPEIFGQVLSEKIEDGLYIGKTTLCAAINLAFIFGAKKIIICGLDLNDWSHFYDERLESRHSHPGQPFPQAKIIHEDLGRISEHAKSKGVDIINANRNSAVNCFRKLPLAVAIKG